MAIKKKVRFCLLDIKNGEAIRIGAVSSPMILSIHDLTPRSSEVCTNVKVQLLQKRDFHSFHKANRSHKAQTGLFMNHEENRLKMLNELIADRQVLILEKMSINRQQPKLVVTKDPELFHSSVLKSKKFPGAYVTATIAAVNAGIQCPACHACPDLKSKTCLRCRKKVNWKEMLLKAGIHIDPCPQPSCFPIIQNKMALDVSRPKPKCKQDIFRESHGTHARTKHLQEKTWVRNMKLAGDMRLADIENIIQMVHEEQTNEIKKVIRNTTRSSDQRNSHFIGRP